MKISSRGVLDNSTFSHCSFDGSKLINFRLGDVKAKQGKLDFQTNVFKFCTVKNQDFAENNCHFIRTRFENVIFENCTFFNPEDEDEKGKSTFRLCLFEKVNFVKCKYAKEQSSVFYPIDEDFFGKNGSDHNSIIKDSFVENEMGLGCKEIELNQVAIDQDLPCPLFENCIFTSLNNCDLSNCIFITCYYRDNSDGDNLKPVDEALLEEVRQKLNLTWSEDYAPQFYVPPTTMTISN